MLIHVAIGARLRRALGATGRPEASWRWPVDSVLGAGSLALVLLALGAVGLLHPPIVLGVTVALALVAHAELLGAAREVAAVFRLRLAHEPGLPAADARAAAVSRALLGALFLLLVATAVAPPTGWDSLMYHLRIPLWLLEQGRVALPPDSFHVALVGSAQYATLPLLAAGILTGPALMQVGALALTVMGTVALARAAGASRFGGWLAVAVLLGCPMFVLVAITARVDVTLVLALLAAHLALLAAADGHDARDLTLAALLVGVAVAIKPLAGAYALVLVPLGWRAARGLRPAFAAAVLAVVVAAPWYLKNQLLVGAPLYPIGAPGWLVPWLADLFGGKVRPEWLDVSILRALPEARTSFNVLDAFFAPGTLTIEGEGVFYALSPLLLALPLIALAWRARTRAAELAFVGLAYSALVVVPFGRINLRYLLPAVPALAVAVAVAIEWTAERAGARLSGITRRVLAVVLLVVALLPLTGALRQRFLTRDLVLLRHAVGAASARDVWRHHPDATARALAPVIENVQRLVPPDGKVLLLWEARGLAFDREVLVDVMLSNWSFLAQSPTALENCLAGTGITHILAGSGAVGYYIERGADRTAFRLDRFAAFRDRCLTGYTVVGPGFELFAVRQPAP